MEKNAAISRNGKKHRTTETGDTDKVKPTPELIEGRNTKMEFMEFMEFMECTRIKSGERATGQPYRCGYYGTEN